MLIGDLTSLGGQRFVLIERDDEQRASAREKKIYAIDLRRRDAEDYLVKRLVVDCSRSATPAGSRRRRGRANSAWPAHREPATAPPRQDGARVGSRFSFPMQSVEALAAVGKAWLLIANDNNLPSSDGRWTERDRQMTRS